MARLDAKVDLALFLVNARDDGAHMVLLAESLEGLAHVLLLVVGDFAAVAQARHIAPVNAEEEAKALHPLHGRLDLLALLEVGEGQLGLGPSLARLGAQRHLNPVVADRKDLAGHDVADGEPRLPVLDKVVEELLDHDAGSDGAAERDEEAVGRHILHDAAHALAGLQVGGAVDLGVDDGRRRVGLHARLARREVDGAALGVDLEHAAEHVVVDLEARSREIVASVRGRDTAADLLAETDHGALRRLADDTAGEDVADGDGVKVPRRRRDTRGNALLGALVRDNDEAARRILRHDDEVLELLADLEALAELVDAHAAVVGQVGQRQERSELRGDEGDDDLLGVDLGHDTRDIGADLELLGRDGRGERLADGRDELLAVLVDVGNAHIDGLADKEDIIQVRNVVGASLGLGDEST